MDNKKETSLEKLLRLKKDNPKDNSSLSKSAIDILVAKEAYHKKQIEIHQKELEETSFLIDMYNRHFNYSKSSEDKEISIKQFYGGGESIEIDMQPIPVLNNHHRFNFSWLTSSNEDDKRGKHFWKSMSVSIITSKNRLLQSSEILDYADLSLNKDERKIEMVILSTTLSELCEEKTLQRMSVPGTKGFYYGLPYMFNGDNAKVEFLALIDK